MCGPVEILQAVAAVAGIAGASKKNSTPAEPPAPAATPQAATEQVAKVPDQQAIKQKNAAAAMSGPMAGPASTALTGPMGVPSTVLTSGNMLGRNSKLGGTA